ncbi:3'-5' exonuclease [Sphingobium sp. B8D3D]|nr:3'-5' exonuclease [Sphingobium sp. B8D3D]MCW2411791.1 DNA polymerase-3 subunit epsilon [Sphingobium sp. B8D3D]MCW2415911.1 DNA polymerase-3 subunit epsilon [Sphingobium sp. B8D3A]
MKILTLGDEEARANALERHADYRVLRRVPDFGQVAYQPLEHPTVRIAVVDTETTGLNPATDAVIELGMTVVELCAEGAPVVIHAPESWTNDPGFPLPPQITDLTGLTDELLAGTAFDDGAINDTLRYVDLIVAHNAAFDRAFMTKAFPLTAERQWACSCRDIDWRAEGFDGHALGHLLTQAGRFNDVHRAGADSWSLTWLLLQDAKDGRTFASHLIEAANTPVHRVYAAHAPFNIKEKLKSAGYRWDPRKHFWYRDRSPAEFESELEWLADLNPNIRPFSQEVHPLDRHATH